MPPPVLRVTRLEHGADLPLPRYETEFSAGLDLRAALEEELAVGSGERVVIPTGLRIEIPPGFEGQVRPRSGLAMKFGLTVLNAPGTIDADYRGELFIALINLGVEPYEIRHGMRIAQLVIAPVAHARVIEAESLDETARGARGFGSTGQTA